MRTHTGGSTVMALSLKRKSPGALTAAPSSNVLVRIVEKSILRSLAFVLYHLERAQARACARSILQWYEQLQRRLPLFAVDSLERFATSFVALSDAEFTAFWLSLVAEPGATPSGRSGQHTAVSIDTVEGEGFEDDPHERDATLVKRLYRQICCRIQRLFGLSTCVQPRDDELLHAQTPLTSPDDKFYHERQLYVRRASLSLAVRQASVGASSSGDYYDYGHGSRDATAVAAPEPSEPGWAVEYMEQESRVSSEITLRMRRMMHSSIPLNLFRVAVVYPANGDDSHDDDALLDAVGFIGVVSPESFPPTPITRDLQTRRIHHYTATVLDHATLALRLLDANYAG